MRIRLALAVLIVAAACVSCVQPPPPSPPAAAAAGPHTGATCDPTDLTGRIIVLPVKPAGQQPLQLTAAMQADLGDAYCNAAREFRRQIDNIDFIFVDATLCPNDPSSCAGISGGQAMGVSWGQRDTAGYTEVGIPAGLWGGQNHAPPYYTYESDLLHQLVPWSNSGAWLNYSSAAPAPANSSWMTVLAALAHEMGHVRWYESTVRTGFGAPSDFKRLSDCSFFLGWQKTSKNALEAAGRWRHFNERINPNTNDHKILPLLGAFQSGVGDQALDDALAALLDKSRPWSSYFGANAPDEDFVETYKFAALIDANLTSLPLAIPASTGAVTRDVPADFLAKNKPDLQKKIRCIKRWT
jgi:hypothetical protein